MAQSSLQQVFTVFAALTIIPGTVLLWVASSKRDKTLDISDPSASTVANAFWLSPNSWNRNAQDYDTFGTLAVWLGAVFVVWFGPQYPKYVPGIRVLVAAMAGYFIMGNPMTNFAMVNLWRRIRDTLFVSPSPSVSFPSELGMWLGGAILCYFGVLCSVLATLRIEITKEYRALRLISWAISLIFISIGCLLLWTGRACEFGNFTNFNAIAQAFSTLGTTGAVLAIFLIGTAAVFSSLLELATASATAIGVHSFFILTSMFEFRSATSLNGNDLKQATAGFAFCWMGMLFSLLASFFVWAAGPPGGTVA